MSELRAEVRDLIEVEVRDNIAGFSIISTETS